MNREILIMFLANGRAPQGLWAFACAVLPAWDALPISLSLMDSQVTASQSQFLGETTDVPHRAHHPPVVLQSSFAPKLGQCILPVRMVLIHLFSHKLSVP